MILKTALFLVTAAVSWTLGGSLIAPKSGGSKPRGSTPATISAGRDEVTGIANRAALDSFFRQLAATEAQTSRRPVRVIHYGDSHTKADLFTGAVRRSLQRDFGGSSAGDARLVKNTVYDPSDSQKIIYQPLGVNGARAKRLRGMTENPAFLQSVAQSRPDLIVIAYGTNEVTDDDWTVDSYARMLVEIIARMRSAAPAASVLVIGPPDRAVLGSGGWASARRMHELMEAERRAAFSAGAAFWSMSDAMGGAGSMNAWVARGLGQPDHVHFTAAGYNRLGALFYRDLMNAYHSNSRGTQPRTPPRTQPGTVRPGLNDLDLRLMRGVPATGKPK
jgi:lysophospholipase L1-like esterase